ncbi:MAG TPA: hypothetical protein VGM17_05465 [Rhizomicrobium sp.]|jgi:hypothetical protein
MFQELRLRRAAASGVVILIHILLLLVVLNALRPAAERVGSLREIVVHILPTPEEEERTRRSRSELPVPEFFQPRSPRAITLPTIPEAAPPAARPEPQGDLDALGRYLYNCTGAEYERLNAKEKAHCLENKWQGKEGEPSLVLGPQKPSPFDVTVTGQRPDSGPAVQPCDPGTPHANYGIGCMNFPHHASDPALLRH